MDKKTGTEKTTHIFGCSFLPNLYIYHWFNYQIQDLTSQKQAFYYEKQDLDFLIREKIGRGRRCSIQIEEKGPCPRLLVHSSIAIGDWLRRRPCSRWRFRVEGGVSAWCATFASVHDVLQPARVVPPLCPRWPLGITCGR